MGSVQQDHEQPGGKNGVHLQDPRHRGAGQRQDQPHQEICPPVLYTALQGDYRGGFCIKVVRLQLWDIAGQERFGNMTRVYYRDAAAAFVVFDLSRIATFEAAAKWKEDLDMKVITGDGSKVPAILLANKCDMPDDQCTVSDEDIEKFAG